MTSTAMSSTLDNLGIKRAGATTTATTTKPAKKSATTLDQGDFLQLLTAQLKNQDPFAPMDNTQMVAQMAQFSSVAGISEMNTTLGAIATKLNATKPSDAMNYVGKTVLTQGNTAYGRASGGLAGQIELDGAASDVAVTIADANGAVVKSLSLGSQQGGTVGYDWDGKTADGKEAGAGPFTISVSAMNGNTAVGSRSLVWAPVQSVSMPATGSPVLTVAGLGQVQLSAVRSVG
jgi:flagellar basal-body rod modification protein FlgD